MESCRGTYIKAFLVWLKAVVSGLDFSYALTLPAGEKVTSVGANLFRFHKIYGIHGFMKKCVFRQEDSLALSHFFRVV